MKIINRRKLALNGFTELLELFTQISFDVRKIPTNLIGNYSVS